MSLSPGSRIGPFEIASRVGEGGMGEVYRAVDSNLARAVAIKVLPDVFALDPERLARFEREAKTLAALNHPHIAQVFGVEKGSGDQPAYALVMEFVDGPTLADRIHLGPIPLDEAIPIAVQIADALESAHDHGIIHRDLKPANVKVRDDGTVKVLDFGLAKSMGSTTASSGLGSVAVANSPTITTPAVTHAGVILGTAAYMSPEQAKGRALDRRTDIWSFGCLLFEMLSGKRAFVGDDTSDVLVSILRDDPPWPALPPETPAHVRALLQRCLQKDVKKRLPHIGVARLELAEPATGELGTQAFDARPARRRTTLIAAGIAAIVIGLALTAISWLRPSAAESPRTHVSIDLGLDPKLENFGTMAIAPDGQSVAVIVRPVDNLSATPVLYLRQFDRLAPQALAGTEGAEMPFFSPDGQSIGFFAAGQLKKISLAGGPATSLCPAPAPRGASWSDDGAIVFSSAGALSRVSAAGGMPQVLYKPDATGLPTAAPQLLPRGRGVLYGEASTGDRAKGTILVRDLAGGAPKVLVQGGRSPQYLTSGHLAFVRSGTLFTVPFDLESFETRGEPVPVVEGIAHALSGLALASVSASGVLAYTQGERSAFPTAPVMWLSQSGPLTPLRPTPSSWLLPRFSPDGRRLALSIYDGRDYDIWVYDWERDILTRVTNSPSLDLGAVWTRDGAGLVFGSNRDGVTNLYWQRADGIGAAQRLTESRLPQLPDSIDPAGRRLVFHEGDPSVTRQRISILTLEGDSTRGRKAGEITPIVTGANLNANAAISPDGRWLAYAANDTGLWEIYVQPFPGPGPRVQVSSGGGNLAVWSPSRSELYYVGSPGQMTRLMKVPYTVSGSTFTPAKATPWAETTFSGPPVNVYGPGFDVHPDGQRFAVASPSTSLSTSERRSGELTLFFGFFDELRRVAHSP